MKIKPPVIDGEINVQDPDEWRFAAGNSDYWHVFPDDKGFAADGLRGGELTNGAKPDSPDDLSFKIYAGFDDQNLYVAVVVKDDDVQTDTAAADSKNGQTWLDDSVEVFVDGANANATRWAKGQVGGQFVITANNAYREEEAGNPGYGENAAWFAKTIRTDVGYTADANGIVTGGYPEHAIVLGESVANRAYFREVMASGKPVIGTPVPASTAKQQPSVPLAVPLRDASGVPLGVLAGYVSLSSPALLGQLESTRIGHSGYFLVVSPGDRLILAAPEANRVLQRLPPRGAIPQLDRRLDEGFEGAGITQAAIGGEQLDVARKMSTTGWIVLAGVPTGEIFAPIENLKRQVYAAAVAISLLVMVLLRVFLTREFAPLRRTAEAMRRMVRREQPFAPLPVTRQDEIGELQASFNQLVVERGQFENALQLTVRRAQALSERLTQVQDEERRELAFELHEQSAQELAALKLQFEALRHHCPGEQAQLQLQEALGLVSVITARVRNMLHFEAPGQGERLPHEVELACFRVVQEALANARQHAKATEVWLSLRLGAGELRLNLRDDGIGFDANGMRNSKPSLSLGLIGMEERARQLGGRLEIKSSPGNGTAIDAAFPLRVASKLGRALERDLSEEPR
ncbi:MAG: HAMP domain-containing protein [Betaproteobacteria bacterium]|nr:HAMP domain-containing protein [Betaproteobacteria bacterium]